MILSRVIAHLCSSGNSLITQWISRKVDARLISCSVSTEGSLHVVSAKDDRELTYDWDENDVISRLEEDAEIVESSAISWILCRYFDEHYETDSLLRDYVKTTTGTTIELVPFSISEKGSLVTSCAVSACKISGESDAKEDDKPSTIVKGDLLGVVLPLSDTDLRDLLIGRLRRIV